MQRVIGRRTGLATAAALVLGLALLITACAAPGGAPPAADAKGRLVLGHVPQWTSTTLVNWVGRVLLEEIGYEVTFQEAEIGIVYQGTAMGDIDVFLDNWYPAQKEHWDAWGDRLERLGTVYTGAKLGWVVPEYVPEVNSIEDLKDHAALFDTDRNGKGEILSYGAGSGGSILSQKVIDEYGLPFELVDSSTVALLAAMQDAINRERPFVGMGWRPHWMSSLWPLKFLDDPKGIWEESTVYVVARQGWIDDYPDLAVFFERFVIPLDDFEALTYEYNVKERDPEEIAREWVANNRALVDAWLSDIK